MLGTTVLHELTHKVNFYPYNLPSMDIRTGMVVPPGTDLHLVIE